MEEGKNLECTLEELHGVWGAECHHSGYRNKRDLRGSVAQGRPLAMEIDERTRSIEPGGVMATACTPRRPEATREAPAEIVVRINWQRARDRPGEWGDGEIQTPAAFSNKWRP
jgi:hypothetical protein